MDRNWVIIVMILAAFVLSGCSESDTVSMDTDLFKPQIEIDDTSLCSITLTDVKIASNPANPEKSALILQGTVGAYCGQLEVTMSPLTGTDEVRINVVAEPPREAPTSSDLQTTKPVYINMTLDTLPKGRYDLFVNGKKYETFATP